MGDFQVLSLDFGRSCHPGILLSALVPQQLFNNNGPLRRGHTDYSAHGFSFRHKGHPCFSHSGTIHLLIISKMLLIFRDIFLSARISPTFAFNSNRTCVMHVAWSGQNHGPDRQNNVVSVVSERYTMPRCQRIINAPIVAHPCQPRETCLEDTPILSPAFAN